MGLHWNVTEVNVGEFFDTCGGSFTMENALHTKIGNIMMSSGMYMQLECVFNVCMQSHCGM